jgi:hypothetical protein
MFSEVIVPSVFLLSKYQSKEEIAAPDLRWTVNVDLVKESDEEEKIDLSAESGEDAPPLLTPVNSKHVLSGSEKIITLLVFV